MQTISISRATCAYELTAANLESGGTPCETIVCIHGWMLSQAYWQPLVAALSTDYRCLTYDLRGFCESVEDAQCRKLNASGSSRYSLSAYARDLEALLDRLNLDKVWLLGHSLGGSIALWAAYLFPERVRGVICVNAGGGIYIDKAFEKFRAAGQQMVKFRPGWLTRLPLLPQVFSRMMVKRPLGAQWGRQRVWDFVRADRMAAEKALLESTTEQEVHQLPVLVGELAVPVHFITASEDAIMPPRYVRYLASFHPQFVEGETVTELADCGHMAMVEQPAAVADVVRFVISQILTRPLSSIEQLSSTDMMHKDIVYEDTAHQDTAHKDTAYKDIMHREN